MSDIQPPPVTTSQTADSEWEALLVSARARRKAMGINSEGDVEGLCDKYRQEKYRSKTSI